MKVEQLFACHQISEEKKVSLATFSFQGNAMYWWTALERDMRINQSPEVKYWNTSKEPLGKDIFPPTIIESSWISSKDSIKIK